MAEAHQISQSARPTLSMPALLLRLEGLAIFALALFFYFREGFGWLPFAIFLLAPDLSALGYLINTRTGAVLYNAVHSLIGPLLVGLLGLLMDWPLALHISLIWLAHIGMDHAAGYGFKYASAFKDTHLGRV